MNKKAFTMIEIIIVMVILGALSILIIKPLMSQIERQQGQEAIQTIKQIKSAMDILGAKNGYDFFVPLFSKDPAEYWNYLGMKDPSNAKFTYLLQGGGENTNIYTITATTVDGHNTIEVDADYSQAVSEDSSNGKIVCKTSSDDGTDVFKGICPEGFNE